MQLTHGEESGVRIRVPGSGRGSIQVFPRYRRHARAFSAPMTAAVKWLRVISAVCLVVAVCAPDWVCAQTEDQSRLILGTDKGAKGDEVFIPLTFSPALGTKIRRISATISFPADAVLFVSARQSASEVEVRAESTPGSSASVVRVEVESQETDGIPSGVVGLLTFKVNQETEVGRTVKFDLTAEALPAGDSTPVVLTTVPGEIELTQVPVVFACYFYMH